MPVKTSDIPRLKQWIADGLNLREMGQKLGSKRQTVRDFLRNHDIPYENQRRVGARNGRWKGGRVIDKDGYVLVLCHDHPNKDRHNYVREHRLVMEHKLGRLLTQDEVVHHVDGDKQNNHPDNLQVFPTNGAHLAETLQGQVPNWTEEGFASMCAPKPRKRDTTPQ